ISSKMLQKALSDVVSDTFNMISVDGDTSTNDMVTIMANGMAENEIIDSENENYEIFKSALFMISTALAKRIAADGEGATKLLECIVMNAKDETTAKTVAKSVICSSLFKSAMFGADANWGRVICAIGYSGAEVDVEKIDISFKSKGNEIKVCENGHGLDFSEELAKEILLNSEIEIIVDLKQGKSSATAYGCDLTYEYVKINGDYRT
ncbi:MAG: bifunctional ornithine acetyltransferase/N-acetylglutamate synthase, partial [Clostridia bacterium]|nr:bifunctional ornithine acetyltransferase/N-acetylglutamate synthase [Clostridia bacterium]